ncbi:hypothetical protein [Streptomyces tagetis]|uniref:hypothetical protein n=1 Tax=Streptomyces tagetis TaxID=2820809 RepID=UPI001FF97F66|nr:hypothetical protein [Streptomyces sp. RG38]
METLHALSRALEVTTATLLAPDAPQPVGRSEDASRVNLIELRAALTPPVGLAETGGEAGEEEPNVRRFRRAVHDGAVLHHSDSYKSVASQLPGLLRDANSAVAYCDNGEEHRQVLLARAEALQLAGQYLTQARQYDLGYTALAGAITDARRARRHPDGSIRRDRHVLAAPVPGTPGRGGSPRRPLEPGRRGPTRPEAGVPRGALRHRSLDARDRRP